MPSRRDNFRLGLAILTMIALLFACLIFLGGRGWQRTRMRPVLVRFAASPAMPELSPGSRVTCFGQTVGKVTAARLIDDVDYRDATVPDRHYLEVEADAWESLNLRSDCQIIAIAPPLGGKGSLDIINRGSAGEPLPLDVPVLGETAGLQAAISQIKRELDDNNPAGMLARVKGELERNDPQAVLGKIHLSLDDINNLTDSLAALSSEFESGDPNSLLGRIHGSVENVNLLTAALARELKPGQDDSVLSRVHSTLSQVDAALTELLSLVRENRDSIDSALASIDHAMQTVDTKIVTTLAEELDRNNPAGMLAAAHEAFARLQQSLVDMNTITGQTKTMVVLNSERIDELVENATQASAILKRGIRDLTLHPWKFLIKPSNAEKRELHLFDTAREFAAAAAHLDDALSRLKAIDNAAQPTSKDYQRDVAEIRSALEKSVERFFDSEQALWMELNGRKKPAAATQKFNGR